MVIPQTEVTVTVDGEVRTVSVLAPGAYEIGRNSDCPLRIVADLVSRRHALLTIEAHGVLIEDLGSTHGTHLDGARVAGPARVRPSQRIQVGAAVLELRSLRPGEEPVPERLPGTISGNRKYEIGKMVARGGMGAILDARDGAIARNVAMKVMLRQASDGDASRFVQEAKITGQLEHPNIVPIYELANDERGEPYYTMKLVHGVTLREVLALLLERDGDTLKKYPLAALLTDFQKVCDALAFAHSRRVIHRDLKPANIMLGDYGEVLVMDWGLAKRLRPSGERAEANEDAPRDEGSRPEAEGGGAYSLETLEGTVMGTPQYMSPEQARGEIETLDPRSDIYALGTILYQLLALRPPVTGRTTSEIISKVSSGQVEPLGTGGGSHLPGGHIPDSLAAVVEKAMAFEPADRYASTEELQADLTAYQSGFATRAENAGAWKHLCLLVQRHRIAAAAIAASLLLIAGVTTLYALGLIAARENAEQARQGTELALEKAKSAQADTEAEKRKAEIASADAIAAREAADQRLAELQRTAPAFFIAANGLVQEDKLEEALSNVATALSLAPGNPEYQLLKGRVLQTMGRLPEAEVVFAAILGQPAEESVRRSAEINRQLCGEIRRMNGPEELSEASLTALAKALDAQGREAEANLLKRKGVKGAEQAEALIKKQLHGSLGKLPKFSWPNHLRLQPDNTFHLDLSGLKTITQIPSLRDLPISELNLSGTQITSLAPLKGLALKKLWMRGTSVSDLGPLAGLPLTELDVSSTAVSDFAALRGAPLRVLYARGNQRLTDLASLAGLSSLELLFLDQSNFADAAPLAGLRNLRALWLSGTRVADLSPLRGLRLEELVVESTGIADKDLRIIGTLPLRRLSIRNCPAVRSLTPLAACRTLEALALPVGHTNFLGIRMLPNLLQLTEDNREALDFSRIPPQVKFWEMHSFNAEEMEPANRAIEVLTESRGRRPKYDITVDGKIEVDMQSVPKNSVEALRHLPIKILNAYGAPIADFSPLATTPIQILALGGPPHLRSRDRLAGSGEDFRSLARLSTLRHLYICHTDLESLEPLVGLPLESLLIHGTRVTDISPLLRMPTLRLVVLPRGITNAALLRSHPGLNSGFISYGEQNPVNDASYPFRRDYLKPAQQFWQEFK